MRRAAALRRLSSEHHTGLVLARRARELTMAPAPERDAGWADLQARFGAELEPHFRLEEEGLLPALRTAGQQALVERTLAEHKALRELIAGGPGALAPFAEALTDHIRFEEAELFETAQAVLEPATSTALAALHERAQVPACPASEVLPKFRLPKGE